MRRRAGRGDALRREGARGDKMFIIIDGEVKLTKHVEDLDFPLQNLRRGAVFGEMALIDNQPHSATALAVTEVSCTVVSKMVFQQKMASEVPIWMQSLFAMLAKRVRLMIANSNGNDNGLPGHQIVDLLYLLLQDGAATGQDAVVLPWDGVVDRLNYIMGQSRQTVDAILKMIVKSGLAKSYLDDKRSKVFAVESLDAFGQFDQFCKERYLVERCKKVPSNTSLIHRQEVELMSMFRKVIGMDEGIRTIGIDEFARRIEAEHKRMIIQYGDAIKNLLAAKVLETAKSKIGNLIYCVNFDLFKSGHAANDLTPVFVETLDNISRIGRPAETIFENQGQPVTDLAG